MKSSRLLRRAIALKAGDRRAALVAISYLAKVSLALKVLPFKKAITIGSVALGPAPRDEAEAIGTAIRSVRRASYAAPWRTVCIHEGLALQLMLRRRGVPAVLCYGTRQINPRLESHVWVKVGDEIVIGAEGAPDFHLLASYPRAEESSTRRPSSSLST